MAGVANPVKATRIDLDLSHYDVDVRGESIYVLLNSMQSGKLKVAENLKSAILHVVSVACPKMQITGVPGQGILMSN